MVTAQSASSLPPQTVQVQLSGLPEAVDRLVAQLASVSEVLSDIPLEPNAEGEILRSVQLVTHPMPRSSMGHGMSVTVQTTVDARGGVFSSPGSDSAAAQVVKDTVERTLQQVPEVKRVHSHVVSLWGLPENETTSSHDPGLR